MNEKLKKFVKKHKTTIITTVVVATPLIVLNVRFFKANRA
jgi:hypothetical protein